MDKKPTFIGAIETEKELECLMEIAKKEYGGSNFKLTFYLLGGTALCLLKLKEATIDIDAVVRGKEEQQELRETLMRAGFMPPVHQIKNIHGNLEPDRVFIKRGSGLRFGLFISDIGQLNFSDSMAKRASIYKKSENIAIYIISKEDLFLLKGLASEARRKDLPDMRSIYPSLDWAIILRELESQDLGGKLTSIFLRRVEAFSQKYHLDIPILPKLKKLIKTKR